MKLVIPTELTTIDPIRDEEAEQTDGLVIEDAPWRRGRQPMNIIKATP